MFKKLAMVFLLVLAPGVCAAGQYDGIWQASGDSHYWLIRHADNGTFVIVGVLVGNSSGLYGQWTDTGIGSIASNVVSDIQIDNVAHRAAVTITFTSPTAGTLFGTSCTSKLAPPANGCAGTPINSSISISKIL
jgi:hypothetical protein